MSILKLQLNLTNMSATDVDDLIRLDAGDDRYSLNRLAGLVKRCAGRAVSGSVRTDRGATAASGTLTFTDNPVADETFSLLNTTFTVRAADAAANEWNLVSGGTAAADAAGNAAAVAAMVNASALSAVLTATSALGVVTFTLLDAGRLGNGVQLSESLTNASVAAFSGGANGTIVTLDFA